MSSTQARCLISLSAIIFAGLFFYNATLKGGSTVYNSNSKHLWNRLNETLFSRTAQDGKKYGMDELDILYWENTKYLLIDPSHQQALAILDEFINSHGEKLIRDPLKRALLQRDLWELFDWSAKASRDASNTRACRELQSRLVVLIRRLALTTNEIALLPDNYAQAEKRNLPDLPHGLFQTNGDWLNVGINDNAVPVAPTHVSEFDGHSAFYLMLHLPDGRESTISYLDRLRSFAQLERARIYPTNRIALLSTNSPRETLELNPNIPQFPTNTEWALVRRMCVIDTTGQIQPTPITESIQVRRYLEIKAINPGERGAQQFFEFQLDRRQSGALRAIGANEKGFPLVHFRGYRTDLFELSSKNSSRDPQPRDSATLQTPILKTCFRCHDGGRGLLSVLSYAGFFSPPPVQRLIDLVPPDGSREATAAIYWKQRQSDWELMQGLWNQTN